MSDGLDVKSPLWDDGPIKEKQLALRFDRGLRRSKAIDRGLRAQGDLVGVRG